MQTGYLLQGLALAPLLVERIVATVPADAYDAQTDPARFTFREALCHLADWEAINLDRLQRGVTEPGCTVPGFDEGQLAIERGYSTRDVAEQVRSFAAGRKRVVAYLKTLKDADWEQVFFHSERGRQTVYEQAVTILGHDVYHLEQFSEFANVRV